MVQNNVILRRGTPKSPRFSSDEPLMEFSEYAEISQEAQYQRSDFSL